MIIKDITKNLIYKLFPTSAQLLQLRNDLKQYQTWVPPGHFYSPIPSQEEIKSYGSALEYNEESLRKQGIFLQPRNQNALFKQILPYLETVPYKDTKQEKYRYFFKNGNFEYFDGSVLYALLHYIKPRKVIEIGSGFSTCIIMDVQEMLGKRSFTFTSIEPYPELVTRLLKKSDLERNTFIPKKLQDLDLKIFDSLNAGDVLFIDSTHVSKFNSDVNREVFDILPRLKKGVYVHFHDIFYPFEYPEAWLKMGIAWNEIYLLRAFLSHNPNFEIVFMNSYFGKKFEGLLKKKFPLGAKNIGGSFWLRKK